MCWIGIFLAVTGLVWGFEWFANGLYWTTSGGKTKVPYAEVFSDTTNISSNSLSTPAVDIVWKNLVKENPTAEVIEVHIPENKNSTIAASTNPDSYTYWQNDNHFYDQYTLKEIQVKHLYGRYKDLTTADKIARMNYDIHVGAILGLPGKVLAFFASLICASLPVTGFIIWWGRKNKDKKGKKKKDKKKKKEVAV